MQTNALREQVRLHQRTQVLVEEVEALQTQLQGGHDGAVFETGGAKGLGLHFAGRIKTVAIGLELGFADIEADGGHDTTKG